jgi:hypothetical protein
VIIKTQKVDPRAEGGARILIKESDRDVSSLKKNSTDIVETNVVFSIILTQIRLNASVTVTIISLGLVNI